MRNEQWLGSTSRHIEQRLVVEGDLVLQTPAQFGNGDSDALTDMPLLVDAHDGVSPLLTGATLAGALRAYLWQRESGYRADDPKPRQRPIAEEDKSLTEILFGAFKRHDEGLQSRLIIDDALGSDYQIQLRDGVRLNPQTRTADAGALFDMQVWSAGTRFPIRLELLLTAPARYKDETAENYTERKNDLFQRLKKALFIALQGLVDGGITLGGRKNRGYGRFLIENWRVKTYNLLKPEGLMDWLQHGNGRLQTSPLASLSTAKPFTPFQNANLTDARSYCRLEAIFTLDGSLLIRANGQPGSKSPDMVHLSNHEGNPVLPGTSVAGALRQRARRILQIVNANQATDWLNDLFGDEKMRDSFKASRLIVEETLITEPIFNLVQNRVAIDRFTGGALESALFNQQPVFAADTTQLQINLTVRQPEKRDIGLLLLLLKDLWTGDLSLGGESSVGRGRLKGICATLTYKENEDKVKSWRLKPARDESIEIESNTEQGLQSFVDALNGKEVPSGT